MLLDELLEGCESPEDIFGKQLGLQLLKRVFAIDLTTCPQCGGAVTLFAAIEDTAVIIKILTHLDLSTLAPPRASARLDAFLQTA